MEHQILSAERRQHTWFDIARAFVRTEMRELLASLWRPLWKVAVGVAALVFLVLGYCTLFLRLTVPEHDPPLALTLLVVLGFSLFYGVTAGFLVGLVNVGQRLVGNRFYWMLLLMGAAVLMTVGWCLDWIDADGKNVVDALSASAASHGFTDTAAGLSGDQLFATSRFLRLVPVVKVFAAPLLVADTPQVLVDGDVFWFYFLYLRIGTFAVLLGLIPSYLLSLVVLWKSGMDHLLARYRKFVADYGVITRYTT